MTKKQNLKQNIRTMLMQMGMPSNIRGFTYMIDAIAIVYEDPTALECVVKGLYVDIANANNTTASKVERALRHFNVCATNSGLYTKHKEFVAQIGKGAPTNTQAISILAYMFSERMKNTTLGTQSRSFNVFDHDDIAIRRALDIKPLVRVDENGKTVKPWEKPAMNLKSNSKLVYARPTEITEPIWRMGELTLKPSNIEADVNFLTSIVTYHDANPQDTNQLSGTVASILKQIPFNVFSQRIAGFEIVDPDLASNQLVFVPEMNDQKRFLITRLYTANDVPEEVSNQPIIYNGKEITRKNVERVLSNVVQKEVNTSDFSK